MLRYFSAKYFRQIFFKCRVDRSGWVDITNGEVGPNLLWHEHMYTVVGFLSDEYDRPQQKPFVWSQGWQDGWVPRLWASPADENL